MDVDSSVRSPAPRRGTLVTVAAVVAGCVALFVNVLLFPDLPDRDVAAERVAVVARAVAIVASEDFRLGRTAKSEVDAAVDKYFVLCKTVERREPSRTFSPTCEEDREMILHGTQVEHRPWSPPQFRGEQKRTTPSKPVTSPPVAWSPGGWWRTRWGMGPSDVDSLIRDVASDFYREPALEKGDYWRQAFVAPMKEPMFGEQTTVFFAFDGGGHLWDVNLVLSRTAGQKNAEEQCERWATSLRTGLRAKYGTEFSEGTWLAPLTVIYLDKVPDRSAGCLVTLRYSQASAELSLPADATPKGAPESSADLKRL